MIALCRRFDGIGALRCTPMSDSLALNLECDSVTSNCVIDLV